MFTPHSVNVAHYASLIRGKSPTKCDAHLTESNFQTCPIADRCSAVLFCRSHPSRIRRR
ncbi:DUF6783 domain-containing protein [Hungatella hominis]|uniref:DUF6783 domain-containing protein n=1 Tax=Hungatella TaxID=1649459 RepID=UPI0032E39C64